MSSLPSASSLSVKAHAKVNLFLSVGAARADGYHDLVSLLHSVTLCDRLCLSRIEEEIEVEGLPPEVPPGEELCLRAARALRASAGARAGARIVVEKAIPARAGLGGGSADAAATLLGLNRLWGLGLSLEALAATAASLGSDVPFFLQGGTALVGGRGEVVRPVACRRELDLVMAKPQGGISTGEAYARLDLSRRQPSPGPGPLLAAIAKGDRAGIARSLHNDFAQVVGEMNPDIMKLKEQMLACGCLGAEVTGSGSAVFGIGAGPKEAEAARAELARRWPWVVAVRSCHSGVEFT